jgi:hypothetical protein
MCYSCNPHDWVYVGGVLRLKTPKTGKHLSCIIGKNELSVDVRILIANALANPSGGDDRYCLIDQGLSVIEEFIKKSRDVAVFFIKGKEIPKEYAIKSLFSKYNKLGKYSRFDVSPDWYVQTDAMQNVVDIINAHYPDMIANTIREREQKTEPKPVPDRSIGLCPPALPLNPCGTNIAQVRAAYEHARDMCHQADNNKYEAKTHYYKLDVAERDYLDSLYQAKKMYGDDNSYRVTLFVLDSFLGCLYPTCPLITRNSKELTPYRMSVRNFYMKIYKTLRRDSISDEKKKSFASRLSSFVTRIGLERKLEIDSDSDYQERYHDLVIVTELLSTNFENFMANVPDNIVIKKNTYVDGFQKKYDDVHSSWTTAKQARDDTILLCDMARKNYAKAKNALSLVY